MDCFAKLDSLGACSNILTAGISIFSIFFNCVTAFAALAAVVYTVKIGRATIKAAKETARYTDDAAKATAASVKETRLASQAQIVSALLDTYANNDMLADIIRLEAWKDDHPNDWDSLFVKARKTEKAAKLADRARRHLAHYHQKAAVFVTHGLISRDMLKSVISMSQVQFAEEHVEPLEVKIAIDGDPHWAYDILRDVHGLPPRS